MIRDNDCLLHRETIRPATSNGEMAILSWFPTIRPTPPKMARNPYSQNSAKTTTSIRPVTPSDGRSPIAVRSFHRSSVPFAPSFRCSTRRWFSSYTNCRPHLNSLTSLPFTINHTKSFHLQLPHVQMNRFGGNASAILSKLRRNIDTVANATTAPRTPYSNPPCL